MFGKLRSLATDTLIYGGTTITVRLLSFLLTPLYTNLLPSQAEFGLNTFLYSVVAFLGIFCSFGFDTAFLRHFDKHDHRKTRRAFSVAFLSVCSLSLATLLILLLASPIFGAQIDGLDTRVELLYILALVVFADALTLVPFGLLRMQGRAKRFAFIRICTIVVNLILNFVLLKVFNLGLLGIVVSNLVASFIAAALLIPELVRYLTLQVKWSDFIAMASYGLPTVPSAVSANVLQVGGRLIMERLAGVAVLGVYQANYRMGITMMMLVSVFEFAWKPFYLNHHTDSEAPKLFTSVFSYFTIAACGIFVIASLFTIDIMRIPIGDGYVVSSLYWEGSQIIPIVLFAYLVSGFSTNFSAAFHISKRTSYLAWAGGLAAVVSVGAHLLLVPSLHFFGGAWATLVAFSVQALFLGVAARKVYPIAVEWPRVVYVVVLAVALVYTTYAFEFGLALKVGTAVLWILLVANPLVLRSDERALILRLLRRIVRRTS